MARPTWSIWSFLGGQFVLGPKEPQPLLNLLGREAALFVTFNGVSILLISVGPPWAREQPTGKLRRGDNNNPMGAGLPRNSAVRGDNLPAMRPLDSADTPNKFAVRILGRASKMALHAVAVEVLGVPVAPPVENHNNPPRPLESRVSSQQHNKLRFVVLIGQAEARQVPYQVVPINKYWHRDTYCSMGRGGQL